jgi:Tfp pilus assembly protein PilZ
MSDKTRDNRRTDERLAINLSARWDGGAGAQEARIEDVSLGGCFVNTQGRVDLGDLIVVEIKLPSEEWLQLRGEVVSCQDGIGFGVVFSFLTDDEEQALRELLS